MNKYQLSRQGIKELYCDDRQFSLVNIRTQEVLAQTCICGSVFCFMVPEILNKPGSKNKMHLFLEYKQDAKLDKPKVRSQEKSYLFVPAPSVLKFNCASGYCQVCQLYYGDYLAHTEEASHKSKIEENKWHKQLKIQAENMKPILRRKGRFANQAGKTRNVKYAKRDKLSGKFAKLE